MLAVSTSVAIVYAVALYGVLIVIPGTVTVLTCSLRCRSGTFCSRRPLFPTRVSGGSL